MTPAAYAPPEMARGHGQPDFKDTVFPLDVHRPPPFSFCAISRPRSPHGESLIYIHSYAKAIYGAMKDYPLHGP
jgi:hypothetical protein